MALITNCNNVISVFTNCNNVVAIYTHCQLVWPTGPVPPGTWYVSWSPSDISGSFSIWGQTRYLQNYSGLYSWTGSTSGYIPEWAFASCNQSQMTYLETNVLSTSQGAFEQLSAVQFISASKMKDVGPYAFCFYSNLQSMYFPVCTHVQQRAFQYCGLEYLFMPNCKTIDTAAFEFCSSLSEINLPACETIHADAFQYCSSLQYVSLPNVKSILGPGSGPFPCCPNISYVSVPECEYINFGGSNTALASVYCPKAKVVGGFNDCPSLTSISLPVCETIFRFQNTGLMSLDLPVCSSIAGSTFNGCTNLSILTLGSAQMIPYPSSIVNGSPSWTPTFESTPFANCSGSIYVPPFLLGDYQTTSGWSSLSCVMKHISSYPEGSYYVEWLPTSGWTSSNTFTIEGHTQVFNYWKTSYPYIYEGVITQSAFKNTSINSIYTNCIGIDKNAFERCSYLESISAPDCEYVGDYAFDGCSSLSEINLPACETIYMATFKSCSNLQVIDLPSVKEIGSYAFDNCSNTSIQFNMPMLEFVDYCAFRSVRCDNLSLPACTYISNYAFQSGRFKTIYLPVCSYIGSYAFSGVTTTNLSITLGSTSVVSLGTSAFGSLASSKVSIFVPSSLVSAYKSAFPYPYGYYCIYPIPE